MIDRERYATLIANHREVGKHYAVLTQLLYAPDCNFNAGAPIDTCHGTAAIIDRFWGPLVRAFTGLERRTDIMLKGQFNGGDWFTSTGNFVGHFENELFGLQPSGRLHALRYAWFDRVERGAIVESYVLLDLARLMIETGAWPLRPPLGVHWSPPPATHDGIHMNEPDPVESQESLTLVENMISGLMRYDQKSLASMGMIRFWTPQFGWYGPGGIGSARGHADYERAHQRPFLTAFPDRVGGNHKCRIGDGCYVASTGWPSMTATHSGNDWLGIAATGKRISQRIMDFWRRDGNGLAENWVFIDMIDVIRQLGIDILPNHREQF